MNAEELYEQGMRLLDDAREGGIAGYSASMAGAYFAAAQARSAIDSQVDALAAVKQSLEQSEPTQLPVTNFVPARDANGNNLYINQHGTILETPDENPMGVWRQLFMRVPS